MDDDLYSFLNDFSSGSTFQRETISAGAVGGRMVPNPEFQQQYNGTREMMGTDYAETYKKEEEKKLYKTFVEDDSMDFEEDGARASKSKLDELDGMSDDDIEDDKKTATTMNAIHEIYRSFEFNRPYVKLPILASKDEILMAIRENAVIIIQGDTGCGKTTQVPQYILDECCRNQTACNIVVTQPRKIAAISNGKRVAFERNCNVGSLVGYQVGLKAELNEQTRLLYCTTGVLLQKLIRSKSMKVYTHVILDEVHDRDEDMDFLLIVVRRLLDKNTKIILMSATIDASRFAQYFELPLPNTTKKMPAPIVLVDQRRQFDVREFYYDELTRIRPSLNDINYDKPGIEDDVYITALRLVMICARLDADEARTNEKKLQRHAILIFLPGLFEIEQMYLKLKESFKKDNIEDENLILPLHSSITKEEQERVFRDTNLGQRKIILATNIAESSITVPNVRFVIDFCLSKSIVTDSNTNYTSLRMDWASRSNCKQRAGRAGRVMHGRVYRLVSKFFYFSLMEEQSTPEILRCPLENVVLKAKMLDMGAPHSILALAMDPPNLSDITNTILILKEVGALLRTCNGKLLETDGDLTFIGRVMAALPLDIRTSRMIIFGYIFSLLDDCIIIAAGLSVRNIFSFPFKKSLIAYQKKLRYADGSSSDCFAILRAYVTWNNQMTHPGARDESQANWGTRNYIQIKAMKEMSYLIDEIKGRLENLGIREATGAMRVRWTQKEQTIVLKIIIAGAFYPNYFIQTSNDGADEREAFATLGGRDPCNSVYFTGFDPKFIGPLYQKKVKEFFTDVIPNLDHIKVSFDNGTSKIYVTIKNYDNMVDNGEFDNTRLSAYVPGRVVPEVYWAVKLRKSADQQILTVMQPHEAVEYAESIGLGIIEGGRLISKQKIFRKSELSIVPSVHTRYLVGFVTHVINCNKFWFQPITDTNEEYMKKIQSILQSSKLKKFENEKDIKVGSLVAASYAEKVGDKELYFRAQVLETLCSRNALFFKVQLIDYGTIATVESSTVRRLDNLKGDIADIPPRCFECKLCEIEPSSIDATRGLWTEQAVKKFQSLTTHVKLKADVYSIVNGVASVTLFSDRLNLNDKLIQTGFAKMSEENYMSKFNHDVRMRHQLEYQGDVLVNLQDDIDEINEISTPDVDPPPEKNCKVRLRLSGPHSPLETKLCSAVRSGGQKSISIEPESVNSVLLDTDPQDAHSRLIVAASISANSNNGGLTIRQTTVMPNIHGFAPLMALIFCPMMECRRDASKSRYTTIMTGLGYDPQTKKALFPEHDMVFDLDIEINDEDLAKINNIRHTMDILMVDQVGKHISLNENQKTQSRAKIKQLLIELLEKERASREIQYSPGRDVWGKNEDDPDMIESHRTYEVDSIFPLHCGLEIRPEVRLSERNVALRRNCAQLHTFAQMTNMQQRPSMITCQLCDLEFESVPQVRLHLLSRLHRDREAQIEYARH